jgi:hypothetical protein
MSASTPVGVASRTHERERCTGEAMGRTAG